MSSINQRDNVLWPTIGYVNRQREQLRHTDQLPTEVVASETHLKLKSREISFTHNSFRGYGIISKFRTEHGSDTAVLCAKFQSDSIAEVDFKKERDLARFELKMRFRRIF